MRWRNKYVLMFVSIVVLAVVGATFRTYMVRASAYTLYASSCLGGWQNTNHAIGAPDASKFDEEVFTRNNSAILRDDVSAQIYCGDFRGDIDTDTAPTKIVVKFSWGIAYPEAVQRIEADAEDESESLQEIGSTTTEGHDSDGTRGATEGERTEATSSTATTSDVVEADDINSAGEASPVSHEEKDAQTNAEVQGMPASALPLPDREESREEAPLEDDSSETVPETSASPTPLSFRHLLGRIAYAQEEVATTFTSTTSSVVGESETTTSTGEDTAFPAARTEYSEEHQGIVEVLYTLDGVFWKSLGYVEHSEFWSKSFEIPISEASQWEDVSQIQISVQRALRIDKVTPTIFLDAVWLEVEYVYADDATLGVPDTSRGDVFLQEVHEGNQTLVLVERPSVEGAVTELWLHDARFVDSEPDDSWKGNMVEPTPVESTVASSSRVLVDTFSPMYEVKSPEAGIASSSASLLFVGNVAPRPYSQSGWMLVAGKDMIADRSPIGFASGTILWLSPDRNALMGIDGTGGGQFSQTIEPHGKTIVRHNNLLSELFLKKDTILLIPIDHEAE